MVPNRGVLQGAFQEGPIKGFKGSKRFHRAGQTAETKMIIYQKGDNQNSLLLELKFALHF